MKKVLIIVVVLVFLGVFAPQLVHKCDDCETIFFGTGYEPNVVADLLKDEGDQIICKECAEIHHALSFLTGKTLDDFKRGLFD